MKSVLFVYSQIIGFASTIFMFYVFYNEAFLGHGVLFIEPNIFVATVEFIMAGVGLALLVATMIGGAWYGRNLTSQDGEVEPNGYPRTGVPYQ